MENKTRIMRLIKIYNDINNLPLESQIMFPKYLKGESLLFAKLDINDLIALNKIFNDDNLDENNNSLFYDIKNYEKYTPGLERLKRKISDTLASKTINSKNCLGVLLISFYQNNYLLIKELNFMIKSIFSKILDYEADNLNPKAIYSFCLNIHLKYFEQKNNQCNYKKLTYEQEIYLKSLVKKIIDEMISYKNADLSDELVSFKLQLYQILLRSIFILSDDYQLMIYYDKYYNDLLDDENPIRDIISAAFIANYDDQKKINLSNLNTPKKVDL